MTFWLEVLIVSIPLTVLALPVGGRAVEPAWVVSALVAFLHLARRLAQGRRPVARGTRFAFAVLLFVALGLFAHAASPYSTGRSLEKGAIQAAGVLCALGATLALVESIHAEPRRFERYVRLLVRVMAALAALGVVQFVVANVLGAPALVDFSFFQTLTGNPGAWRFPGTIGGLLRSSSLAAEPSHLALFLGTVGGLSLLRLGLYGDGFRRGAARTMRRWQAWTVVLCFLLTLSLVGYALLAATVALVYLCVRRLTVRLVAGTATVGAAALLAVVVWSSQTERELGQKLTTVPLIFTSARNLDANVETQALSAVAILSNRLVTARNLEERPLVGVGFGAHPESFGHHAPAFENFENRLNVQDASGLLLRLLSETGLLGTLLFLGAWVVVFLRAREAILRHLEAGVLTFAEAQRISLAAGLTAGGAAVFLAYLGRMGLYYAPTLWVLLGLVATVPTVLRRSTA